MKDLIERQAAIDAINGVLVEDDACKVWFRLALQNLPPAQPYTDAEIKKMQNLEQVQFDKIRELAYQEGKADAMRWISCSERLPEHGGRYLISVLDGINRRTTVAPYMPRCKAWTMTGRMTYWKVIAWMPLPEPPKEDDHETN